VSGNDILIVIARSEVTKQSPFLFKSEIATPTFGGLAMTVLLIAIARSEATFLSLRAVAKQSRFSQ
jgi:hypothetical protein